VVVGRSVGLRGGWTKRGPCGSRTKRGSWCHRWTRHGHKGRRRRYILLVLIPVPTVGQGVGRNVGAWVGDKGWALHFFGPHLLFPRVVAQSLSEQQKLFVLPLLAQIPTSLAKRLLLGSFADFLICDVRLTRSGTIRFGDGA
jgi:hypothetical protein